MKAGLEARALYVTALCYSANHLTDGFVTVEVTPLLTAMSQISNGDEAVKKLIDVGLWEVCNGGFMIHDYLVYNPNGDKVRAERAANAARQARFRGGSNAVTNAITNNVTNGTPVPVPVPIKKNSKSPKKNGDTCPKEWMEALYNICEIDISLASSGMRKRISDTGKALIESGAKLGDVERFGVWWLSDEWRAKNMPAPTPEKVRDNWSKMNGNGHRPETQEPPTPPKTTNHKEFTAWGSTGQGDRSRTLWERF
jgi:hypothetical protein